MLTSKDYRVQQSRLNDLRRAAEQRAKAEAARPFTENDDPALYAATLATVGKTMVEVGSRLEARYGTLADEVPPAANAQRVLG